MLSLGGVKRRGFLCLILGTLAALTLLPSARAQTLNTGTVTGIVTDPSGALMPACVVRLRDRSTLVSRTTVSNQDGRYLFVAVVPGTYDVEASKEGFTQAVVASLVVEVTKTYSVTLRLKLGQVQQTVQVNATSAQELQTMDATVGNTLGSSELLALPSITRDVSNLILLQPLVMPGTPTWNSGQGAVAGSQSDQNTFMLDGLDVSDMFEGTGSYWSSSDPQSGAIPATTESIQEFRVDTTNPEASFVGSSGGQVMMVSKRGTDLFHGSAYEYLLNSALGANSWTLNRVGQPRPVSQDNHFGASFGGYIPLPSRNSKTYFYTNYEGRRQRIGEPITRQVPLPGLKQGILTFPDNAGNVVQYNLATSMQCGPSGNGACDPRGLGMNPLISTLWNKYMPKGNLTGGADPTNSNQFIGNLPLPFTSNLGVARVDHAISDKWQLSSTYRYYTSFQARDRQWDIGGLFPGDRLGVAASNSFTPHDPRQFSISLSGVLRPTLTNELTFGYLRDNWSWQTAREFPQVAGTDAAMVGNLMNPMNFDNGSIRERSWNGHRTEILDNLAWQKGTHLLRFGGSIQRNIGWFWRSDSQGTNVWPAYNIGASGCAYNGAGGGGCGIVIPQQYMPPICSAAGQVNCLRPGDINNWLNDYTQVLGMVESGTQFLTRAANLDINPAGTNLADNVHYSMYSLNGSDAWRVRPSITIQLGLNWMVDMPPHEVNGEQIMPVTVANGQFSVISDPFAFMAARQSAAVKGQVYNPVLGSLPIRNSGRKYPYNPYYGDLAPRVGLAWNPQVGGTGFMGRLLGDGKTVIRGGFGQIFDRLNAVQRAGDPLQAFGYGEALSCQGPSRATGTCMGAGGVDPVTGLRIGVDGSSVPIPTLPAQTTVPLIPGPAGLPGANQPAGYADFADQVNYKPARVNEFDITIQRALPHNNILEIGYVQKNARNIYGGVDLDTPPFMMVYGGQSYAKAFDNVRAALIAGQTPAPQPFFEAALAGNAICTPTCTSGIVNQYASTILGMNWWPLWNNLSGNGVTSNFVFGQATPIAQFSDYGFYGHGGISNYNAGFLSYRIRDWKGLTLDANFTYSHSLDDVLGCRQDCDIASTNGYNLKWDYGTSTFDRKFVGYIYGMYRLPFGRKGGNRFVNQLIRDWAVTPIYSKYSGLPLKVFDGGMGATLTTKDTFGNTVHTGVPGDTTTGVGTAGSPAAGGTGLNLFANPNAVFNAFRPFLLSQDTRTGGGGQIRGQPRWNMDLGVSRKFTITERFSTTFQANAYNLFNKVEFNDPSLSLQNPAAFGVISGQYNLPRQVEVSLRVDF